MELDPMPLFARLFLQILKSIKNANYDVASKFDNTFRFVDYLIAINYGNEFENHYYEIYPFEIALKKEILHTPRLLF